RREGKGQNKGIELVLGGNTFQGVVGLLFLQLVVDGSVVQLAADKDRDKGHHDGQDERHTPAPAVDLGFGQGCVDGCGGRGTQQEGDAGGKGHRAGCRCTTVGGGAFHQEDTGSGPFAADHHALQEPQHDQQDRRRNADGVVAGQQTDQGREYTHAKDRNHQHGLAAKAVANGAQDQGAKGARDKAHGKYGQGRQQGNASGVGGEVDAADNGCKVAINGEVKPFHKVADTDGNNLFSTQARLAWGCRIGMRRGDGSSAHRYLLEQGR